MLHLTPDSHFYNKYKGANLKKNVLQKGGGIFYPWVVPCEEPCVPNAMSSVLFYQSLIQCFNNKSIFDQFSSDIMA